VFTRKKAQIKRQTSWKHWSLSP